MDKEDKRVHLVKKFRNIIYLLQTNINNRNIKKKIIFVYIFCVLVPVLMTNIVIIGTTLIAARDEQRESIDKIISSVSHDMTSSFDNAAYVSAVIYASDSISNFLEKHYETTSDFFLAYNKVFDNYVFYVSSNHIISSISLYSDNETMINGGKYFRVSAMNSEEWYQQLHSAKQDLMIFPYYNANLTFESNRNRIISVVRKLNYYGRRDVEKLVKLDLNYSQMSESINESAFDTIIYVCHGDKILFTNDKIDKGLKDEYLSVSMLPMSEIQKHVLVSSYGFDFDIYLRGYKSNYSSMLRSKLWLIAVLFLADAILPAVMLTLFSNSITKRILILGKYLKKIKKEEFDPIPRQAGRDEIGELLIDYNLMAARMKDLIEYEYKSKLEQQELYLARQQAELHALYSQINPHFMFNVLETIRMRSVIKGEKETSQMIESLAGLMRKSAEWGSDLITMEQELSFVKDYLSLQKYRFGEGFHYKIKIEDDCATYIIPSLVLVTFAENSCVHGLNRKEHSGSIFVSIYKEDDFLNIEIEDTGIGMDEEKARDLEDILNKADISELQRSSSLGMLNAGIRLKKSCGNKTRIIIESELQVGTCIIIKIPIDDLKRQESNPY